MNTHLCMSVAFLDGVPEFHGRRQDGAPEWPPSPLRLYQALVAAAAGHWGRPGWLEAAGPALRWLESQPAPVVVAPPAETGVGRVVAVPNNSLDVVSRAYKRGVLFGTGKNSPAAHRTMKPVRPTLPEGDTLYYLWQLPPGGEGCPFFEALLETAAALNCLGWGTDLVAGHARLLTREEAAALEGQRWQPTGRALGGYGLRVPVRGTLDDVEGCFQSFLKRVTFNVGQTVPRRPSVFDLLEYRHGLDPALRPVAAFELWRREARLGDLPSGHGRFRAFEATRCGVTVAMAVRGTVEAAARQADWREEDVQTVVLGHTPDGQDCLRGGVDVLRLAYLPLPSLEWRGVTSRSQRKLGDVRRVLITAPPGLARAVDWLRQVLVNADLVNLEGKHVATLMPAQLQSTGVKPYLGPARRWSTATPVILPGFAEHDSRLTEELLWLSLHHAGVAEEVIPKVDLEYQRLPFRPGGEDARRYAQRKLPERTCFHVRLTFPEPYPGPLFIGMGRYYGIGTLVADDQ